MKTSIVKELKKVVEEMNLPLVYGEKKYRWSFTDYHKTKDPNITQSSVKFVGLYLSDEDKETVVLEMEKKGFRFEFLKETYPPHPYFDGDYGNYGTRICFSSIKNKEYPIKEPFSITSDRLETIRTLLFDSKTEVMFKSDEVKEYFKNVKEIQCLHNNKVYEFNPYKEEVYLFHKDYWIKNIMDQSQKDYFLKEHNIDVSHPSQKEWIWVKLTDKNKLANIIKK
jgi:hypothetical protein